MSANRTDLPGAKFYKADLHIHTPASKCWEGPKDSAEIERLFRKLSELNIEVVAITDHNSVQNVESAKKLGEKYGIHVYPGVEVSTKEGHVLAIFDPNKPTADIQNWLARVGITQANYGDPKVVAKNVDSEQIGITTVFRLIEQEGGVSIAPHPNSSETGFLEVLKQKGTARQEAYHSPYLRGLEVGSNKSQILNLAAGNVPGYTKKYGCIASSDAHKIDNVGSSFTYIKLGDFGIGALKQVFYDPAMRIRFPENWPPKRHAQIESLEVSQGFFDGVSFQFHPDTNCIIGGKAVGKSLLIELIKFALGIRSPIEEVNNNSDCIMRAHACLGDGGTVTLHIVSENGERYRIQRTVSDLDEGPEVYYADTETKAAQAVVDVFKCKIYSQNEVIELGKNLPALLEWLDGFVDLSSEQSRINEIREQTKLLLKRLDEQHTVATRIEPLTTNIKELKEKRELLEKKVKEPILKAFPSWQQEERQLREMNRGLQRLIEEIIVPLEKIRIEEYIPELKGQTPNHKEIAEQRKNLLEVCSDFQKAAGYLRQALVAKQNSFQGFITGWRAKFDQAKQKHEEVIKSAGVKDASALTSELNKVNLAIEKFEDELAKAKEASRQKSALENTLRNALIPEYVECFRNIFKKRLDKATAINKSLDSFVRISVIQMNDRSDFEKVAEVLAKGSGLRKDEQNQITNKVTPVELAQLLIEKDSTQLCKKTGLKQERLTSFIETAWSKCRTDEGVELLSKMYKIMLTELKDSVCVELRVDKDVYKPMNELSVGSKCTAILSVALVEGQYPLVIDQPEDALDNPFVFQQIVRTVRRTKMDRQYIFATHNPNVAVASDADLIHCLKATASRGNVDRHGSIDQVLTRDKIIANLEGGNDAFRLRSQKYDIIVEDPNAVVLDIQSLD